ncbi:uncharacterized protein LOC143658717 [Tamandua tetradactyla]|uniref:uncharacterized protein LOC143658717 n=1 Tax=Tamandua tetradactyla TaxID=48850 RepID=UPI004053872A
MEVLPDNSTLRTVVSCRFFLVTFFCPYWLEVCVPGATMYLGLRSTCEAYVCRHLLEADHLKTVWLLLSAAMATAVFALLSILLMASVHLWEPGLVNMFSAVASYLTGERLAEGWGLQLGSLMKDGAWPPGSCMAVPSTSCPGTAGSAPLHDRGPLPGHPPLHRGHIFLGFLPGLWRLHLILAHRHPHSGLGARLTGSHIPSRSASQVIYRMRMGACLRLHKPFRIVILYALPALGLSSNPGLENLSTPLPQPPSPRTQVWASSPFPSPPSALGALVPKLLFWWGP